MPARRDILKGAAALPAIGLTGLPRFAHADAEALCFIVDGRLPGAAVLAARAAAAGHALADPHGEIVPLLLKMDKRRTVPGGMIVGLTGYSDFVLARDILRTSARPMRHALTLEGTARRPVAGGDPTDGAARMLAALLGPLSPVPSRSTGFLWLA